MKKAFPVGVENFEDIVLPEGLRGAVLSETFGRRWTKREVMIYFETGAVRKRTASVCCTLCYEHSLNLWTVC
ncbi:MAG: hypothetical protein HFG99_00520 [Dorea sp.]|jgi:hypothetical protein|nr:hypothetical protein [Dorea sp.]